MSEKLGPVELEFTIDKQVQEDARKLQESIGGIGSASQRSAAAMKQAIAEQRAVIQGIEGDIKKIEQQALRAAPGLAQKGVVQELQAAKRALEEESAALNQLEQEMKKVDASTTSLVTRKRKLLQVVAEMEMAGKRGTEEYRRMRQELAELTDAHGDASAQARILGDETRHMQGAIEGLSAFAGALSAGAGAMGLLTGNSEAFQKIQTRVQSLMAITIGLHQVSLALNKDSAFQLVIVAKAKTMYAKAVGYLNTKLKINIGLSRAMVVTGIGAIIAAVGLLIVAIQRWRERQQEVNDLQKQFGELSPEVAKNIAQERVEINTLLRVAGNYNASLETRNRAIEKLKSIMPEYNGYINQEGRLIDNSSEALLRHIEVLRKVEIAKKMIARQAEIEAAITEVEAGERDEEISRETRRRARRAPLIAHLASMQTMRTGGMAPEAFTAQEARETRQSLLKEGREEVIAAYKEEKTLLDAQLKTLFEDVDVFSAFFGGDKDAGKGADAAAKQAAARQYDAAAELQNRLLELQAQNARLLFDQREDNLQKRLEQLDREHQGELQKIDEFVRSVIEKHNEANQGKEGFVALGTGAGDLMASMATIDPASAEGFEKELEQLAAVYAQRRVQIQQDAAGQVEAIMQELASSYQTEQERELQAVRDKYAKIREEVIRFQGFLTAAQEQAIQAAQQKAEAAINDTWFVRTSGAFTTLFGDIEMKSSRALRQALEVAKQIVEEKAASLNPADFEAFMRSITNAEALLRQRNPFRALIQSITQYRTTLNQAAREDALKQIFQNSADIAGQVSGYIGEVMTAVGQLGGASDQQQKTIEQITTAVTGAGEIAMGIATKNPMKIVQGTIKLITSGIALLDTQGREIERNMERARKQLDILTQSYRALERATQQALGTDVFKAQADEIRNLQKQIFTTHQLINEERRKSDKKRDDNAIQAWQADIQDLQYRIEDIYQEIFEKITQTSVKGLADDLANALVNAFETGADAAEAFGEIANNVLQSAVRNALKMELLEKPLAEAMKRLQQKMGTFDDQGVFRLGKLTEDEANAFRDEIARIGQVYATALGELGHIFNVADSPDKALTGAIQGVTEQTAQLLGGQMNAIRLNQAESLSLVRQQLLHMAEIAINTRHLLEIRDIMRDIRDDKPLRPQGL